MRRVAAKRNYLMLHNDETVHYPFSKFLTHEFDNDSTRELASQSLRIFYRFSESYEIELVVRAVEGKCLTYDECKKLVGLCYRPLGEIESISNKKVVLLTSAKAGKPPESLPSAVEPNTAQKRLINIAKYIKFYRQVLIEPNIYSETLLKKIQYEFEKVEDQLKNEITGTKQGHHHDIRSLPSPKFLEIIRAIFLKPEEIFLTESGKPSRTMQRDRAMALIACEGLRPGAIGNIARADFRDKSRHLVIEDHREDREKTTSSTPVLKLGASTQVNSASETMIELWDFTVFAISEYIENERDFILAKSLKNRSKGFLFLNEKGKPIKHRSTITKMFSGLGKRLSELGLLDVGNDPYFVNQKRYDFYAYVLRHSSCSLFLERKGTEDSVLDSMKTRYGWTANSPQPKRYAARALSDKANVDLMDFNNNLMSEVRAKRKSIVSK